MKHTELKINGSARSQTKGKVPRCENIIKNHVRVMKNINKTNRPIEG